MATWLLIAASSAVALGAAGVDVEVRSIRGEPEYGELVALTADEVRLETADGPQTFPRRGLLSVAPTTPSPLIPTSLEDAPIVVQLTDGSRIPAAAYSVAGRRVEIEIVGGGIAKTTTRAVHWVRFFQPQLQTRAPWERILASDLTADAIVIRKSSEPATTDLQPEAATVVLDYLEGVLTDVGADEVGFEFDGTQVKVPRAKVEGFVYFHPPVRTLTEPVAAISDTSGGTWHIKSVSLENETLDLVTVAGVRHSLPLHQLLDVDFSLGNIDYLSDLEPESIVWRPRHELSITPAVRRWFQPEPNDGLHGRPLRLGGTTFEKGLALHSYSEVRYRLTRPYRVLLAKIGIDDSSRQNGELELRLLGDGGLLLQRRITIGEEPFDLELDIAGVRRLTIIVDFGDDSDRGDNLYLCDVRLVK